VIPCSCTSCQVRLDALTPTPVLLRFGSFELDPDKAELREAGVLRRLPAQPFRVLALLAGRPGELVSRQEIRYCLWGDRKYIDVDRGINFCISQIRGVLRDPAGSSRYIKSVPRQGYRFAAAVDRIALTSEAALPIEPADWAVPAADKLEFVARTPVPATTRMSRPRLLGGALMSLTFSVLLATDVPSPAAVHATIGPMDSIVVADFVNLTGDRVFDDTLKQALITQLQQSPSLSVVSEEKQRSALTLMRLTGSERMTRSIGMDLCRRIGSKAVVAAEISRMGSHYLLDVKAISCAAGDILDSEQREVSRKEDILTALAQASAGLRAGLGESLPSIQKFEVPEPFTTVSLEALRSYAQGIKVLKAQGDAPSIPLFKRAVELDPLFPMAYASLAARYNNLEQPGRALEYATKAYELRSRVSERERLIITSRYHRLRGEMEQLTQVLDQWISEYPNDAAPHGSLGVNFIIRGQFPQALAELQTAFSLQEDDASIYENTAMLYIAWNRPNEAHAALDDAATHHLDTGGLGTLAYYVGFLQGDSAAMQKQADWALGKPGTEDVVLSAESDTEAFSGRLESARKMSLRAADSARRAGFTEAAALWMVNAALRDAEYGDPEAARRGASDALDLATGKNVKVLAALCLARSGDTDAASKLVDQLEKDYASDTMLAVYRVPTIKAAIALSERIPKKALEILDGVKPYDLARPSPAGMASMYPSYLRGLAYAMLGDSTDAEREFLQVVNNRGLTLNSPLGVLGALQLARVYAMNGRVEQAKPLYRHFLIDWKDADPDSISLRAARADYASLR
jgi:DNA-binding winged helix-turn-helix (wHTH) protein/tetratricopeptide (TPR) repeat protein